MAESLKKDVHVLKMKHMRGKEELVPWILGRVFFFSPQQLKSLYFYLKCRVKLCRTLSKSRMYLLMHRPYGTLEWVLMVPK